MAVIPDKVQNAKVYLEGNAILGVADVELPKVDFFQKLPRLHNKQRFSFL